MLLFWAGKSRSGPRSVLLLGDSIGVGLAAPLAREAVARHVAFTAAVKSGSTAGLWRARAAELVRRGQTVVVSLGTNDCKDPRSRACERFPDRARAIDELVRDRGGRTLWLVPTWVPWAATIRLGLREAGQVAQELGTDVPVAPDGIHPTPEGYRVLARRVAPLVMP